MITTRIASTLFVASGAISCLVFACGESRESIDPGGGSFDTDGGDGSDPCTAVRCSRDLKSVISVCEGREQIIETCKDGMGCGDGRCVEACTSAELSKGSVGCSFWTMPPEDIYRKTPSCFAAMVANTWDGPAVVTAEFGNEPLDISKSIYTAEKVGAKVVYTPLKGPLPSGGVALVFLSRGTKSPTTPREFQPCPEGVQPALEIDPLRHGTAIERAFHLKTDVPISAFSIYPYGGAASQVPAATLLLPVSSWGKNYVALTTGTFRMAGGNSPVEFVPATTLQIVADEDDTEVRIRPTADIADGEGVPGTAQGFPAKWTLSRGQVLQLAQKAELTGSAIETTKRVGLFGGTECAYIPSTYPACDFLHQQMPALSQWGSEYALVPYPTRVPSIEGNEVRERVLWRLVGAVEGTQLAYDPVRPEGAPETLGAGQAAVFMTESFVAVKSQDGAHPFHAGVYMTGATFNGTVDGTAHADTPGDPDYVNVVPSDQFLDRYVFFTDHTYPETSLTIVRKKTASGFRPVELDCAGEITNFQPLGSKGDYEFAWVKLAVGGNPQPFSKGTCQYGRREATSDGPFSVTVWGTAAYASYGYAGGMGSRPINTASVPVPR